MAARENQGYLIAVIILVLLTLVLALLTFLGWSKANEYAEGIDSSKAQLNGAQMLSQAHQIEAEILRALVGDLGESNAEVQTKIDSVNRLANNNSTSDAQKTAIQNVVVRIKEVKDAYDRDMQQFISRTEEDQAEDLTWTGVLRNLIAVTARKHNELSVKRQENEDEKGRLEREKKTLQGRLDVAEGALEKAKEGFAKKQKLDQDNISGLNEMLANVQRDIQAYEKATGAKITNLESINSELEAKVDDLVVKNVDLTKTKQELTRENFDIHDGEIVRVSRTSSSNLVYLNIGRKDGLRTNQTFAVYDRNVNNFEKGEQKAKIEVIDILGPKSSEALITEENPIDPITRLDRIVTPTWDPGNRNDIAISGVIDLDGDNNSDLLRFIRMIENNGGRVVAYHDEEGKIFGKIDSSTRYLVKGESPKLGPDPNNGEIYSAIRELEKQAKDNAIRVIDLRQMLNRIGRHLIRVYKNDPQIQDLPSAGSSSRDQGSSSRDQGSGTKDHGSGTKDQGSSTR